MHFKLYTLFILAALLASVNGAAIKRAAQGGTLQIGDMVQPTPAPTPTVSLSTTLDGSVTGDEDEKDPRTDDAIILAKSKKPKVKKIKTSSSTTTTITTTITSTGITGLPTTTSNFTTTYVTTYTSVVGRGGGSTRISIFNKMVIMIGLITAAVILLL